MGKIVVAEVVAPAEKERALKELNSCDEQCQIVSVPIRVLTGNEDEFFAPPVRLKAEFAITDDLQAKTPAGAAGIVLTPNEEQVYYPKVPSASISMDDARYFAPARTSSERTPLMKGELFAVFETGKVLGITSNGNYYTALNFTIQIMEEIRTYSDSDDFATSLLIRVTTKSGKEQDFVIKTADYGRLYEIVKREMPGVFRHSKAINASSEYFAKCFDDCENLPIKNLTRYSGWHEIDGIIRYHIGCESVYKDAQDPYTMEVSPEKAVADGLAFLSVGRKGPEVAMILLFAHVAFLLFWFERQGLKFQSLLYVVGSTGNLKTAVMKVMSNVLDQGGPLSRGIKITSSEASTKEILNYFRDTFVLLDDYSKNNSANNTRAKNNRYNVTRFLADETVETKMDFTKPGKIADTDFRTVVAFTGEDFMDVGESTELRTVTVEFDNDTIDEKLLSVFQQKDGPMLAYFCVFIRFLTKYGLTLERYFGESFLEYRSLYGKRFPRMRRLADTSALLRITVDVIRKFALWSGCGDTRSDIEIFSNAIDFCLTRQAKLTKMLRPYVIFIRALFGSLAFGIRNPATGVAESEAEYNESPQSFIGYRGTKDGEDVTSLRFDPAWQVVFQYFKKMGKDFCETEKSIKEELLKNKVIFGIPRAKGRGPVYSFKKGKEPRHNMTIFRMEAVDEILDQREE